MNMEDKIIYLYYTEKLMQKDIATKLNISTSKVSRVIAKDSRYIDEKNSRKQSNRIKHNKDIQNRVVEERKKEQFRNSADDLILKNEHNQAAIEMSTRSHLSNENYRKWNYSAYKYNPSKKRYEFRDELGRSADVPKYIKERI